MSFAIKKEIMEQLLDLVDQTSNEKHERLLDMAYDLIEMTLSDEEILDLDGKKDNEEHKELLKYNDEDWDN